MSDSLPVGTAGDYSCLHKAAPKIKELSVRNSNKMQHYNI